DPFLKPDGSRVKSQNEWPEQRKYIIAMLEHYQYGKRPPTPKDVTVKETFSKDTLDGTATRKLYTMTINRNGKSLDFHFGLLKPKGNGPFPVIIKNGDISIEIDPKSESHGIPPEIFLQAIKRGYIICEYRRTDLSSDISGTLEENRNNGVFPLYPEPEYTWGTIAAFAWGTSLIIDYFEKVNFVDINKIAATSWSRGGKTAFCAGIFDERIAVTAPSSSGLGGTASHRYFELAAMRDQTIGRHITRNPHWWSPEYYKLAGFEALAPFDSHFGRAAIAPRAFYNDHSYQDYWANPFGTWLTYEAAKMVYKWLGVEDNIAMHWRTGGHAQNVIDWTALMDFCDWYYYGNTDFADYYYLWGARTDNPHPFKYNAYPTVRLPINWDVPGSNTITPPVYWGKPKERKLWDKSKD
ncbi:hypothetical protein ACFLTU_09820, partial [Bacteroidota bacterium]